MGEYIRVRVRIYAAYDCHSDGKLAAIFSLFLAYARLDVFIDSRFWTLPDIYRSAIVMLSLSVADEVG